MATATWHRHPLRFPIHSRRLVDPNENLGKMFRPILAGHPYFSSTARYIGYPGDTTSMNFEVVRVFAVDKGYTCRG
jgi:hypothetical protein